MKAKIAKFVRDSLGLSEVVLVIPKETSFGHFAAPIAFSLAKSLKKPPQTIALELCEKLRGAEIFEKVEAIAGYINFTLSDRFLDGEAASALKENDKFGTAGEIGSDKIGEKREKILLEFVSANPTGPLHVGHARGAFYGDALARLARHLGHSVTTEYYVNDAGNQVDLLGRSIYCRARAEITENGEPFPAECYQGEYIHDLAQRARAKFGDEIFANGASGASGAETAENSAEKLKEISLWAKDAMLEWIKETMRQAGVEFDSFVSERSLYDRWDAARAKLEACGALYTDGEGKIWLASSKKGDNEDRVVVRENGAPTYLAGDIIYHDDKFSRSFDRCINIWGADHHGYIARVKAAIAFLGFDSDRLEVLLSQMVALLKNGSPYKMSKRSGNFVTMEEVGAETGFDALRFVFLAKRANTHLEFDIDDLKKEDSTNPVFYVNYAHARICSLFEKLGAAPSDFADEPLEKLPADAKDLLFFALSLSEIIRESFASREPHLLCDYLYKLSVKTHKFYADNRVIGSVYEARFAKILAVTALSIRLGMRLLGITAKTRM